MIIEVNTTSLHNLLETFEKQEWPHADFEHYGNKQPNFFRQGFRLVYLEDDKILGFVFVYVDTGVAEISSLLVSQDHQGMGIGSQLLHEAERRAKSMGAHKAWLTTGATWRARSLYKKLGYAEVALLRNYYAGQDFVYFDKDLA